MFISIHLGNEGDVVNQINAVDFIVKYFANCRL